MFGSILTGATSSLGILQVALCFLTSALSGFLVAETYRHCENPSANFLKGLAVLPAIVQIVILMVNGNLGVGVAVAGSFSLVRFRSLPGKASDILFIFLAMGLGLCTGMGYVLFALTACIAVCGLYLLYAKTNVLSADANYRNVRITMPEDLDYANVFEEIFSEYTTDFNIESVRTINLGTMYQVEYSIHLKDAKDEKKMLDQLRIRNGNLPVICGRTATVATEL